MGVSNDTIYKDSYVTLENYSQVINQDIMLNGYSNSIFSTRYSYYFESNNVDITDFYWNASKNIGSGNYMFQFKNTAWNGTDPFTLQQRVGFQVLNHEPTISTTGSFFQGTSFNQTQVENGYVRIQSINAGTPLDLTVMGTDVETGPLEMSAFVLFSLTYIIGDNVGLLPFHAVPIIERLTRDENDRFQGSITIPNEVTYSIGGSNITKCMATTEKYLGALIVVLRDDDGSYDYFIILLNISVVYPVDIFFIISLISVCGVAIAILMFVRKRTRQYKVPGEYAKERLPYDFKFCPYCGNEVGGTRVMYCPRCHKEIDFY